MRYLLALLLTGCAYQVTDYPTQPEMTVGIDRSVEVVDLRVHWHNSVDELAHSCKDSRPMFVVYGCAKWVVQDGRSYCVIQAIPPKDFNDIPLLAVLGHELVHCFGARHG